MIGTYENVIASRKQGIEKKTAYLVGGGIASLAAAAYFPRSQTRFGNAFPDALRHLISTQRRAL
jgi:myosin-crossreactive antigen